MSVIDEIAAERARQISEDGWTPEHDDEHGEGEMAMAAAAYAFAAGADEEKRQHWMLTAPPWWRWDRVWWKPKDRRRDLMRAGALIVAEIERLDRAAQVVLTKQECGGDTK